MAIERCKSSKTTYEDGDCLYLYSNDGLLIDGACVTNCSIFCTDLKYLYSGADILADCLGTVTVWNDGSQSRVNKTPDTLDATVQIIDTCMQDYCTASHHLLGGCPYRNISDIINAQHSSNRIGYEKSVKYIFAGETGACNIARTINPDIGGPGVVIAFVIQISLALLICFALIFYSAKAKWLLRPSKGASEDQREQTKETYAIVSMIMVEFQEAQSWFIIVNEIAGLVGMKGSTRFQSTSFLQLRSNWNYIALTSSAAAVFNMITLMAINFIGIHNLYTNAISTLAWIGAVVMGISVDVIQNRSGDPSIDDLGLSDLVISVPACGAPSLEGYLGGYSFHLLTNSPAMEGLFHMLAMTTSGVFMLCLLIIWLVPCFRSQILRSDVGRGLKVIWIIVVFSPFIVIYFLMFGRMFSRGIVSVKGWGVGQVFAVAIWIPVITHGAYAVARGMSAFSDIRTVKPYAIVDTSSFLEQDHDNEATGAMSQATNSATALEIVGGAAVPHQGMTDAEPAAGSSQTTRPS